MHEDRGLSLGVMARCMKIVISFIDDDFHISLCAKML